MRDRMLYQLLACDARTGFATRCVGGLGVDTDDDSCHHEVVLASHVDNDGGWHSLIDGTVAAAAATQPPTTFAEKMTEWEPNGITWELVEADPEWVPERDSLRDALFAYLERVLVQEKPNPRVLDAISSEEAQLVAAAASTGGE